MECQYKIRKARNTDKQQIHDLVRASIASEKKLANPSLVPNGFMEEFVDKMIHKGLMLVVENDMQEVEMIGEVHDYQTAATPEHNPSPLKEFIFLSRLHKPDCNEETQLVNWLLGEIRNKYHDVFRVKLNTPVSSNASVDYYKKMGLRVEGNFYGRLKNNAEQHRLLVPFSWFNPS